MPFTTPEFEAIRAAILRDIGNQLPQAVVGVDSDYGIRAAAHAAAIEGLYQHQLWVVRQIFPDTADTDYLERHCSLRGLARKSGTVASGVLRFEGVAGSTVPIGLETRTAAGVVFLTTDSATIAGSGLADVPAQAIAPGVAGNQSGSTPLTVTSGASGIASTAQVVSMTGGTERESDADLLARLLHLLRNPPMGGAAHDYVAWATAVAGVTRAYVYPLRRGLGTVDVVIMTAGGIPDPGLVAATQAAIDPLRPVQADFMVLAPTAVPVAITAALTLADGAVFATVEAAIEAAITAYFAGLEPGETVYSNRLRALISDTPGVLDFTLSAPASNVVALFDPTHTEICTLGTLTLT